MSLWLHLQDDYRGESVWTCSHRADGAFATSTDINAFAEAFAQVAGPEWPSRLLVSQRSTQTLTPYRGRFVPSQSKCKREHLHYDVVLTLNEAEAVALRMIRSTDRWDTSPEQ